MEYYVKKNKPTKPAEPNKSQKPQEEAVQPPKTDQLEEQKNENQISQAATKSNQQEETKDSKPKNPYGKTYKFVHMTGDWKMVSESLTPLSQGKVTLEGIINIMDKFARKFEVGSQGNFYILKDFLMGLNKNEKTECEKQVFPFLAQLILKTPDLFRNGLPILTQRCEDQVILSKEQCACLLAHMFMCTTIDQKNHKLPNTYNFLTICTKEKFGQNVRLNKLICMIRYFTRVMKEMPPRSIIVERLVYTENIHGKNTLAAWRECQDGLKEVEIKPKGKIEDEDGAIEVDFANKFLGGGALRTGAAQEEIQFITSPELFIGILFCEFMLETEAILMKGAEIYCSYKGYSDRFTFTADYNDMRPMETQSLLSREVVAIDALNFKHSDVIPQFSEEGVLREINKAYVGFFGSLHANNSSQGARKCISTGKWGCGVFEGNTQLKFLVQWIAASRVNRKMVFYSFEDTKGLRGVENVLEYYKGKKVGDLVEDLLVACKEVDRSEKHNPNLFDVLMLSKKVPKM